MAEFTVGGDVFTQRYKKQARFTSGCDIVMGDHPTDGKHYMGLHNPSTEAWIGSPTVINPADFGSAAEALAKAKKLWQVTQA